MRKFLVIVFLVIMYTTGALAQEIVKAKDVHNYIGKTVTIIGKIRDVAGPGYLTSMDFYLITDSTEIGVGVIIPMAVWRKSKVINEKQKGKIMKVTGLLKGNEEPYIEVKNISNIEILK